MLRSFSGSFRIVIALLVMSVVTMSEAADTDIPKIQKDLVGSWIVDVGGVARKITLNIKGAELGQDSAWILDSTYGWTDGVQTAVSAKLIVKSDGYKLLLTTQANNLISADYSSSTGLFSGTFTWTSGTVRTVRLERMSDEEMGKLAAILTASRMRSTIKQPAANVPASCAGFVGGWTGTWPAYGQTWLWVVEVDVNCVAKFSHRGTPAFPETFGTAEIKAGVLAFPDRQGDIDSFELRSAGEIWARHYQPGRDNNTVFRKFHPGEK